MKYEPWQKHCIRCALAVLVALPVCFGAPARAQFDRVKSVWLTGPGNQEYDVAAILAKYPKLTKLYVPLRPVSLASTSDQGMPTQDADTESRVYARCKARGVELIGIYSPFVVPAGREADDPLLELPLAQAFASPRRSTLRRVEPPDENAYPAQLEGLLSEYQVDGIVLDLNLPQDLYSYSPASRARFIKKYHFDPVDASYPSKFYEKGAEGNAALVDLIVRHRLEAAQELVGNLTKVCRERHKRVEALSSADISGWTLPARAASLADWPAWAKEDSDLTFVLSGESSGRVSPFTELAKTLAALHIAPTRITYLARSQGEFDRLASARGNQDPEMVLLLPRGK